MNKNSPQNVESPSDSFVKVRRGKVESVDLYEIKDSELDVLEQGTPATLQLNFAIFLFSTAFTPLCRVYHTCRAVAMRDYYSFSPLKYRIFRRIIYK